MKRISILLVLGLLLGACASGGRRSGDVAGVAPALSVERFLQAANARDVEAMSRLFGTGEGPIIERTGSTVGCFFRWMGGLFGVDGCTSKLEIERRMLALALILEHDDYRMGGQERLPAREYPGIQVRVTLVRGGQEIPNVPFIVVQTGDGSWLVEQVDVETITEHGSS